jgi:hypothetical protein
MKYPSERTREASRTMKRYLKTGSIEPKSQQHSDLSDLTDEQLIEMLSGATKKQTARIIRELASRVTPHR